jgi:hypothetical protein
MFAVSKLKAAGVPVAAVLALVACSPGGGGDDEKPTAVAVDFCPDARHPGVQDKAPDGQTSVEFVNWAAADKSGKVPVVVECITKAELVKRVKAAAKLVSAAEKRFDTYLDQRQYPVAFSDRLRAAVDFYCASSGAQQAYYNYVPAEQYYVDNWEDLPTNKFNQDFARQVDKQCASVRELDDRYDGVEIRTKPFEG